MIESFNTSEERNHRCMEVLRAGGTITKLCGDGTDNSPLILEYNYSTVWHA